jgi:hypothetical protein
MRKALLALTLPTLLGMGSLAFADTITTSTNTIACQDEACTTFDTMHSALQPFDGSLGMLTGITLQIDANSSTTYYAHFPDFSGPNPSTGSADLSYQSPFDAVVNGLSYSFELTGSQNVSVIGDPAEVLQKYTFGATGSGTFTLDPALFSLFIGTSDVCGDPSFGKLGVCVTGQPETSPTLNNIVQSVDNLVLVQMGPPPYTTNNATYTLTYTYNPFAVPEPGTWAMMLLGFGGIGIAVRKRTPSYG